MCWVSWLQAGLITTHQNETGLPRFLIGARVSCYLGYPSNSCSVVQISRSWFLFLCSTSDVIYLVSNSGFVLGFYLLTPRLTLTLTSYHSRAGSCPFGLVLLPLHTLPAYARRSSCIHIIMRYVNTGLCWAILYRSPNTSILFELGSFMSDTFWSDFSLIGTICIYHWISISQWSISLTQGVKWLKSGWLYSLRNRSPKSQMQMKIR